MTYAGVIKMVKERMQPTKLHNPADRMALEVVKWQGVLAECLLQKKPSIEKMQEAYGNLGLHLMLLFFRNETPYSNEVVRLENTQYHLLYISNCISLRHSEVLNWLQHYIAIWDGIAHAFDLDCTEGSVHFEKSVKRFFNTETLWP